MSITFRSPKESKLLIFDQETESQLGQSVLADIEYEILHARKEKFSLHPKTIAYAIGNSISLYIRNRKSGKRMGIAGNIYFSYLLAFVQVTKPKVVFTFIDNDWRFQLMSRLYNKATFIAVQNGVRSEFNLRVDLPPRNHPGYPISMTTLYCFGELEKGDYERFGHTVDNFVPVGSVQASWFKYKLGTRENRSPNYDLALISQWSRDVMQGDCYPEIRRSVAQTDLYLKKFLDNHPLKFAVALRSNDDEECRYYRSVFGDSAILVDRQTKEMSSYFVANNSEVVVVLDSTLGREAYGWGKKVLFINFTGHDCYRTPVDEISYLDELDFNVFKSKLEFLLTESSEDFCCRTKATRDALVSQKIVAFKKIRTDILSLLSK